MMLFINSVDVKKYKKYMWPLLACLIFFLISSPAMALLLGVVISIVFGNQEIKYTSLLSKYLLQIAVIMLGFGLQLSVILKVGYSSIGITFFSILFTMTFGYFLSRWLKIDQELSILISSGTSICGGSAIAAISPSIEASSANTAISLAIVFLLNAIALLIFPMVGHYLSMDQVSFGLWSAIAIHDTSSVVGATAIYGTIALSIGTTVKLTRALWILPLSFGITYFKKSKSGTKIPWFLLGFLIAALCRSYFTSYIDIYNFLAIQGKHLLVATLFLIGAGITIENLKKIGILPLFFAVVLWMTISIVSLILITQGVISIKL